jgi:hypothetical protein
MSWSSGNSDVILYGNERLKKHYFDEAELPLKVARLGVNRYTFNEMTTRLGGISSLKEEIPGLMIGLAGIEYFFLRLLEPTTIPLYPCSKEGDAFKGNIFP